MENPKEETKREFVNNTSKWNIEDFEEPKQDYNGVHLRHCYQGEYEDCCKYGEDDCPAKLLNKPKQETLEEAAERLYPNKEYPMYGEIRRDGFINGVKWQQERSYSEEEVDELLDKLLEGNMCSHAGDELIRQFKKK